MRELQRIRVIWESCFNNARDKQKLLGRSVVSLSARSRDCALLILEVKATSLSLNVERAEHRHIGGGGT
jgi:hypothetical protein